MKERGYGRIVNIASNAAIGTALPGAMFYAATKAEILILTRRLRWSPLALDIACRDGRIKRGDLVMIEAMGGGFTWGAALIRW